MTRYTLQDGRLVHVHTRQPLLTDEERNAPVKLPTVQSDIPEYESPIDGRVISSRSHRRDDMARHNCVDARDFKSPTGGKIRNKEFAAKRGLTVSEEYR